MDEPEKLRFHEVIAWLYPAGDQGFHQAVGLAAERSWTFPLSGPDFAEKVEAELRKAYPDVRIAVEGPASVGADRAEAVWRVYRDG